MTQQLGLKGVLVREVYANSPAAQAGIRPTQALGLRQGSRVRRLIRLGDLIVAIDQKPINNLDDWFSSLEQRKVGDQVTLTVVRDLRSTGQSELQLQVTLDEHQP
jgi:S1-C subfamily serine protease